MKIKAHFFNPRGGGKVLNFEQDLVRRPSFGEGSSFVERSPHHKANHLIDREFATVPGDDHLTVSQDRNAISQFNDLLEMVRDVNNPDSALLQLPDLQKQSLRIGHG